MKLVLILCMFFVMPPFTIFAESSCEREFKQLTEQRNKAISSATEAIDKNYQKALRQLLLKATQTNDTKVIAAIAEALKGNAELTPDFIGIWILSVGEWTGINDVRADGSVTQDNTPGTWTATDKKLKCNYNNGVWVEFDLPVRNGKLIGISSRNERVMAKKKSE